MSGRNQCSAARGFAGIIGKGTSSTQCEGENVWRMRSGQQAALSHIVKALSLGLFTGAAGLCAALLPAGFDLEENIGLGVLFSLRGVRQPPSEVAVVSMDEGSARNLALPDNPEKWPRSYHARLVEQLVHAGAEVIIFDVFFQEEKVRQDDELFAQAIAKARNVVLCEGVKRERVSARTMKGEEAEGASIERLVPPTRLLADAALAHAPFPLPKVPVRVSEYWTFKTEAGDAPTLPIVAFQVFHLGLYDDLVALLRRVDPSRTAKLPHLATAITATERVEKAVGAVRELFRMDPALADRMLDSIERDNAGIERWKGAPLRALIRMYGSPDSEYLNFYGPPETITTIPYHEIVRRGSEGGQSGIDLRGKAVFVGSSGSGFLPQRDAFHTVFSGPSGRDISGVEIAATAFANLVQEMPVRPLSPPALAAVVFFWGLVLGFSCRLSPTLAAILSGLALSAVYLIIAAYHFTKSAVWYPVAITLFFQSPLAMFGAVLWNYLEINKERRNVRRALSYYLPSGVADRLSKNVVDMTAANQQVYGICLCTDAEGYTSLAERMGPGELGAFLNRYYETVFRPIRSRGGMVSDVVGDSALAVWVAPRHDRERREAACAAALDIMRDLRSASGFSPGPPVPTRIGLHAGDIMLGNIGAMDHYEYRPVGDIVNTATRIQGLNKHVGTGVLASADVVEGIDGFLAREVGRFLLAGKSRPLVIYEVMCRIEDADRDKVLLCNTFAAGLSAFRVGRWGEAHIKFRECMDLDPGDGPSLYYAGLCERYEKEPPGEDWDGVIRVDTK